MSLKTGACLQEKNEINKNNIHGIGRDSDKMHYMCTKQG